MAYLPLLSRFRVNRAIRLMVCTVLGLLVVLTAQRPALAQQGTVSGRVVDAEISEPLSGVVIELRTGGGTLVQSAMTDADGRFTLTRIPQGRYTLLISSLGYETQRVERVSVGTEPHSVGTIELVSRAFRLNPIVVTASRGQEKSLESPATVHTVTAEEVKEKTQPTTADYVIGLPGVDNVSTGLSQHNVVARGFNNVFSGALFVLTDNRWASVPSLRFNAYNLIPATTDDIDRIEFVLGPGSALYGPNVDKGVMHIITRSPLDHQETRLSLVGGVRAGNETVTSTEPVWQGLFRHAGLFSENVGYKLSAMYFRGDDWVFIDPVEQVNREAAIAAGADPDTLLIGKRNFNQERVTADARIDWRINPRSTLIVAGGVTSMFNSIEMTGIGSAQARDWTYWYTQARYRQGNLFAQAYLNMSDAGDTYTLRDGLPIRDNSYLWAAQLQHASILGERQRFVYGADMIRTVPRTNGTVNGRNEDDDDITEYGAYVQSETALSPQWDLVLAARLDYHSVVDDLVFSPRAAIVFKPTPEHNIRLTYNRAFTQPTSVNLFLDLLSSPTLGPFADFGVRALGVPSKTGLTFRRDCSGGLCMRSPFDADPRQFLPLDVTPYWQNAVDGLNAVFLAQTGQPLNPQLEALLRSLDPTGQVSTVLKTFDAEQLAFGSIESEAAAAIDIPALVPSITNTIEIGYKGLIGDRLLLGVDAYWQRVQDFIGPLNFETPNTFLSPTDLGQFLEGPLLAAGVPPEQIPLIIGGLANVPLGTVTPEQVPLANPTDLYVTYRNFGDVDLWGLDIGLTFLLTDEFSLTGSYSLACGYLDSGSTCVNLWPNLDNIDDVALNAPIHKATLGLGYRSPRIGLGVELRGRYVDSYPVNSGVFAGNISSFTLFDANITYQLPLATATEVTLTATNIFDETHQEMIGAPFIGRMVLLRVTQTF